MATTSGEIGSMLYISSKISEIEGAKELKDNAMMTALMNTVVVNNVASFCYLFFKESCSINHVDSFGNTLLHLAAKSNAI